MRSTLLLLFAACESVSEPEFPSPTFTFIGGDDPSTGLTVKAPLYELQFGGTMVEEMHFPTALTIGGSENKLGVNMDCGPEDRVGIAMFPALVTQNKPMQRTSIPPNEFTDEGTFIEHNGISFFLRGEHLVKVGITYTMDYECQGPQRLTGQTIFTMFPNGRIVRDEFAMVPSADALMIPQGLEDCGCGRIGDAGGAQQFFYTSYWTFTGGGTVVDRDENPIANSMDPAPNGACSKYSDAAIAVSYADGTDRIVIQSPSGNVAHVKDLQRGARIDPLAMGETEPRTMSSAIQVHDTGAPTCEQLQASLDEPPIIVGDRTLMVAGPDGVYADDVSHTESFDITLFRDEEALAPGWALFTTIPGGAAEIRRVPESSRPDGRVALVQRESPNSDRFYFIFDEGLGPGTSITIVPK